MSHEIDLIIPEQEMIVIVEQVLRSGNLIHGVRPRKASPWKMADILSRGLTFGYSVGRTDFCTAILSKRPLPERLQQAQHEGPGGWYNNSGYPVDWFNIAIVISREKALARWPNKAQAIGSLFSDESLRDLVEEYYGFDDGKVFEIPVVNIDGERFGDEVRFSFNQWEEIVASPPEDWDGIIIDEEKLDPYLKFCRDAGFIPQLPVISPKCQLLAIQ